MIDFSKVKLPDAPVGATTTMGAETGTVWTAPDSPFIADDIGSIVDLNLGGARRALKIFDDSAAEMEAQAAALEVKSEVEAKNATEMTGQVKRFAKKVDDRRKEIIAEPDTFVRKVNAFCKPISDRLKKIEAVLKSKLGDYAYQQELQRREIERRQREEAARLQAELDQQAKAKGVDPVQVVPVAMPTRKEPTRSDSAVASTVMVWKHEVTDPQAVPREYLMVDDAAIKAAIRGGIRKIDGVRIYEEAEVRIRKIA